jgi:hypothetical protein
VNKIRAAQLTLTLGSHFGQDMAFVSVFTLVASRRFLEALGRSTVYLDLRHFLTPHSKYLSADLVQQIGQAEVLVVNV